MPESVREAPWLVSVRSRMVQMRSHDDIYSRSYYENDVEGDAVRSAPVIARTIVEAFAPTFVLDVGCGTGAVLAAFDARGVDTLGLEYSSAALDLCRGRGVDVIQFDIETDSPRPEWRTSTVLSMEVAEHIPERLADRFVDTLCACSEANVCFTAAVPGQEGDDHVNLQPNSYWIEKFAERSFRFDEALSDDLRRQWAAGDVADFYVANLMIFERRTD